MRNIILIVLSVFVAVAAGGVCISWFAQSIAAKTAVANAIANINAQKPYLTYESIESSGFPSHLYISLVRPHFTGRVDEALKALPDGARYASLPAWDTDMLLDGRITLGVNALSDHYSLTIDGPMKATSVIAGQAMATASQPAGETVCELTLAGGGMLGALWNFQPLMRDGKALLSDVRMLDCASPGHAVIDPATNQVLERAGAARFYVTSVPLGDNRQVRVYGKIADMEVTPQGDALMATYRLLFSPGNPFPVKYSLYGKQNGEIDFSYDGPADWDKVGKNPPLKITLAKFLLDSQISHYDATLEFINGMAGNNRSTHLAFKAEENFGDVYDAVQPDMVRGAIAELYASKDPRFEKLASFLSQHTPEQVYDIVAPAIPNLHSLGKMTQSADMSFLGDPDMSVGDVTLAGLELSASPYGITAHGAAKLTAKQLPTGTLALSCSNCLRLIDDMAAYAARAQKTASAFDPVIAAAWVPNPQWLEGMKAFLAALAPQPQDAADKTTLNYTLVSGDTGLTVNGKALPEVMTLYDQYMALAQKSDAPPAPK